MPYLSRDHLPTSSYLRLPLVVTLVDDLDFASRDEGVNLHSQRPPRPTSRRGHTPGIPTQELLSCPSTLS